MKKFIIPIIIILAIIVAVIIYSLNPESKEKIYNLNQVDEDCEALTPAIEETCDPAKIIYIPKEYWYDNPFLKTFLQNSSPSDFQTYLPATCAYGTNPLEQMLPLIPKDMTSQSGKLEKNLIENNQTETTKNLKPLSQFSLTIQFFENIGDTTNFFNRRLNISKLNAEKDINTIKIINDKSFTITRRSEIGEGEYMIYYETIIQKENRIISTLDFYEENSQPRCNQDKITKLINAI
ncbi:MAG: hypothetical protein Q8P57_00645 [Candidatus Pacearchaeota archaeon]|nr:hypothetical protein [Candidatus Pacearchaeota archaeon]